VFGSISTPNGLAPYASKSVETMSNLDAKVKIAQEDQKLK
jgi:hypothetical protein